MKRRQVIPVASIFILALLLLVFYPLAEPYILEYKKIAGETQGTTYHITYEDRTGRELQPRIEQLLAKFDLSLSTYIPNSIISRINNNEKVKVDRYFRDVYTKAEEVYHLSNGAFDITIGSIVRAWGFGPDKKAEIDSMLVDSLLQYVGMEKIALNGNHLLKKLPGIKLDVNAIAQGYSVDIVCEFLERKGITNYLVEIGGELKAKGTNPRDTLWRIGIDKPVEGNFMPGQNLQATMAINNKAIATSGNYRKFFEKDGIKYAHSINPKTGYPVLSRLLSVTVMADDCMTADAYATAFMIMGLERSISFLGSQEKIDAYLIYSDDEGNFKTFMTKGIKNSLTEVTN